MENEVPELDLDETSDSFYEVLFAMHDNDEGEFFEGDRLDESLGDDRFDESIGDDRLNESLGDLLSSISPLSSEPYAILGTVEKCVKTLHSCLSKDLTQNRNSSIIQNMLDKCVQELKTKALELGETEKREVFTSFY